jgi:hypothetical protein
VKDIVIKATGVYRMSLYKILEDSSVRSVTLSHIAPPHSKTRKKAQFSEIFR